MLGSALNWTVKSSHRNVFERLYADAVERIQRMTELRAQFVALQKVQVSGMIVDEHEQLLNNPPLMSGGAIGAAPALAPGRTAFQDFLVREYHNLQMQQQMPQGQFQQAPAPRPGVTPGAFTQLTQQMQAAADGLYPIGRAQFGQDAPRAYSLERRSSELAMMGQIGPGSAKLARSPSPSQRSLVKDFPVHNNFAPAPQIGGRLVQGQPGSSSQASMSVPHSAQGLGGNVTAGSQKRIL